VFFTTGALKRILRSSQKDRRRTPAGHTVPASALHRQQEARIGWLEHSDT
jgi:hypothetical protein